MHITQQTLDLLEDKYLFEPGTEMAQNDSLLIKNNIKTYLIPPQYYGASYNQYQSYNSDDVNRRYSSNIKRMMGRTSRANVRKLLLQFY